MILETIVWSGLKPSAITLVAISFKIVNQKKEILRGRNEKENEINEDEDTPKKINKDNNLVGNNSR